MKKKKKNFEADNVTTKIVDFIVQWHYNQT